MAGIGGRDDAVYLHYAVVADRYLGTRRHIAAKPVGLRQSPEHAGCRWFAPAALFGHGVEHRQRFGHVGEQLAAQSQRVLFGLMGDFVEETFDVNRVLVQVDPAPEADRHVRVADGMVNQQVGDGVGELRLGTRRVQTLKDHRVFEVDDVLRRHLREDGLSSNSHVQRGQVALRIQPRRHFGL